MVPVGIGFNKTTVIGGKLPIRFGLEYHYSAVRPDDFGQEHNIRFYIVPVVPNPVKVMQGTFVPPNL